MIARCVWLWPLSFFPSQPSSLSFTPSLRKFYINVGVFHVLLRVCTEFTQRSVQATMEHEVHVFQCTALCFLCAQSWQQTNPRERVGGNMGQPVGNALPLDPRESVGEHNSLKIRFHRQYNLSDWCRRQETPFYLKVSVLWRPVVSLSLSISPATCIIRSSRQNRSTPSPPTPSPPLPTHCQQLSSSNI